MKKKIFEIFLVMLVIAPLIYISVDQSVSANSSISDKQSLTNLSKKLDVPLQKYDTKISFTTKMNTSSLKSIVKKYFQSLQKSNPYLAYSLSKYRYTASYDTAGNVQFNFTITYHTTAAQEKKVTSKINTLSTKLFKKGMTQFEKVNAINDYITRQTMYSTKTKASPHSAYAVLYEGKGVCQGYALVALRLLDQAGITNYYVTGTSKGIAHAWNKVKIDGKWYNLDTTWNDPTNSDRPAVMYKYFLINDAQLKKDHTWTTANYPAATASTYNHLNNSFYTDIVGKTIYFTQNFKIYKQTAGSTKKTKLSTDNSTYVAANSKYVYYINYNKNKKLTRITKAGKSKKTYAYKPATLDVHNGYLIFQDTRNGKKMKIKIGA